MVHILLGYIELISTRIIQFLWTFGLQWEALTKKSNWLCLENSYI